MLNCKTIVARDKREIMPAPRLFFGRNKSSRERDNFSPVTRDRRRRGSSRQIEREFSGFPFQSGSMTAEEFHSALQEATNYRLRGFVLPYLKHTLPSLQRDLSGAARASNQVSASITRGLYPSAAGRVCNRRMCSSVSDGRRVCRIKNTGPTPGGFLIRARRMQRE